MFASATSGDRPNNSKFSACSVGNISAVLDAVRDGRKRNCLNESAGAFCGNKIVEVGEECDCGQSFARADLALVSEGGHIVVVQSQGVII